MLIRLFRRILRLITPAGRSGPDAETATDTFAVAERSPEQADYACGHRSDAAFVMDFYGEKIAPGEDYLARRLQCADCMLDEARKRSIRCCLCGFIILPGNAVALYAGGAKFRKDRTETADRQKIGCMRWDCCPSGGFFAGHWTDRGFVGAFANGSLAAEVFATGKPIAVSDGKVIKKE